MNKKLVIYLILLLSMAFLSASCGAQELEMETVEPAMGVPADSTGPPTVTLTPENIQIIPSITFQPDIPETEGYTFDELGISLEVPADLFVIKDPIVNPDDSSKLDAYLFYIQDYGYPGGPSSGDFQIYGSLQFDLPPVSWEEFAALQDNTAEYEYVKAIEINGLRGFETQLAGQRNNFVYLFYLDDHILRIAVSSPTQENKSLAEEILKTIEYSP